MGLDPELAALMQEQITVEPATGVDKYAETQYGTAVTVDAYIVHSTVQTIDREGKEVTSVVQMFLASPELVLTPDARVTLPDGSQPKLMSVHSARDEFNEPYYLELRA